MNLSVQGQLYVLEPSINEFANYERSFKQEVVSPVQNKVGQLFLSPSLRNILGQVGTTINFRFMMDENRIFIANLSKGLVGETHSSLLGSLLITGFELAALSRADCPIHERKDFFLYADEFHHYATDSFAGILSEARKYRLSLTLAHQYIGQLDERIANAVFGNVGTLLAFRVSESDGSVLERQFGGNPLSSQFTSLDNYELCARLLNREPFFARSLAPLDLERRRRKIVIRQSRKKYGKKKRIVEKKIEQWLNRKH